MWHEFTKNLWYNTFNFTGKNLCSSIHKICFLKFSYIIVNVPDTWGSLMLGPDSKRGCLLQWTHSWAAVLHWYAHSQEQPHSLDVKHTANKGLLYNSTVHVTVKQYYHQTLNDSGISFTLDIQLFPTNTQPNPGLTWSNWSKISILILGPPP